MSGSYQPRKRRGSRLWWRLWLLLGLLLMWLPGSDRAAVHWMDGVASGFHLIWFALGGFLWRWVGVKVASRYAWIGLVAYGIVLEIGQGWIPHRDPSLVDTAMNAIGAAVGLWSPRTHFGGVSAATSDRVDGRSDSPPNR